MHRYLTWWEPIPGPATSDFKVYYSYSIRQAQDDADVAITCLENNTGQHTRDPGTRARGEEDVWANWPEWTGWTIAKE